MTVIFCFGEELKDRKADKHFEVGKISAGKWTFSYFKRRLETGNSCLRAGMGHWYWRNRKSRTGAGNARLYS